MGNPANALALTKHAYDQCKAALLVLSKDAGSRDENLKTMDVAPSDAEALENLLKKELQRTRALVEISNLRKKAGKGDTSTTSRPLINRLGQYPSEGVDLDNIVPYPPKLEPIPVKPLFLDVAWNYVQYPSSADKASVPPRKETSKPEADKQPAKKGWFGFGRG